MNILRKRAQETTSPHRSRFYCGSYREADSLLLQGRPSGEFLVPVIGSPCRSLVPILQLESALASEISSKPWGCTVDILDLLTRAALELIAQGGLGHTFNSFENSKEFMEFQWAITSVL